MAPHASDDLPQVAQYLSVNQNREFPRDELGNYLRAAWSTGTATKLPEAVPRPKPTRRSIPLDR